VYVLLPSATNFPVLDAAVVTWEGQEKGQWVMDAFQCTLARSHPAPHGAGGDFMNLTEPAKGKVRLRRLVYVGFEPRSSPVYLGVTTVQMREDASGKATLPFLEERQQMMNVRDLIPVKG
jgi:hypothetical protein